MTDNLYQLNVSYLPVEDRLFLRINTREGHEFRLWLTRRYTGLLLGRLRSAMERHGGAPVLASRSETRQLFREGAMDKPYEADKAADYPLGEDGVLASRIRTRAGAQGILRLELLPEKGQGVTLQLDKTLLFMFHNLLMQGCAQSGWGLGDADPGKVH